MFIGLISKIHDPQLTSHFRPISLCNTIYKIIAKCLANRSRPCVQDIINPFQSAFITNTQIHNNILIAREIMNKFKNTKGKKARVALKLDIEKAYDRVE